MKKMILVACSLLFAVSAMAQNDTLVRMKELCVIGNRSELVLTMGGYRIALADRSKPLPKTTFSIGITNIEFGFSLLTSPSYAGYSAQERDFLDLRTGKSIHVGFRLFDLGIALDKQRTFVLHTGVHLMCDNYTFNKNITLQNIDGRIEPWMLDRNYRKSKLITAAFGIPVQILFRPTKQITLSALLYGDLVYNAHMKYKKPKQKERLSGVADFQTGVGVSVAYRGYGLYAKYGFSPLFRRGVGPAAHPISVGFYFGL